MALSKGRLLFAAIGACAIAGAVWFGWTNRSLNTASDLISCVPRSGATVAYIDVEALRNSGYLELIAGSKPSEEPDYRKFVEATGFDYRRDLKRVAGSFSTGGTFFAVSGVFDWKRLEAYAKGQGGLCRDGVCRLSSSQPGRWISFYIVRAGTLGIAFSGNEFAALDIVPHKQAGPTAAEPTAPVWALVPAASLTEAPLPAGTRSFTSPLASAESIVFTLGPRNQGLELNLDVTCVSASAASDLLVKLEGATNMLRKLIEREHLKPNPNDLSGLLTSGEFRRDDRKVLGLWPIRREFVESIASGAVK
jgi:hypothetical protein